MSLRAKLHSVRRCAFRCRRAAQPSSASPDDADPRPTPGGAPGATEGESTIVIGMLRGMQKQIYRFTAAPVLRRVQCAIPATGGAAQSPTTWCGPVARHGHRRQVLPLQTARKVRAENLCYSADFTCHSCGYTQQVINQETYLMSDLRAPLKLQHLPACMISTNQLNCLTVHYTKVWAVHFNLSVACHMRAHVHQAAFARSAMGGRRSAAPKVE